MRSWLCALGPLVVLFLATLYGAMSYWSEYTEHAQTIPWDEHDCSVVATKLGRRRGGFRSEILVTNYTDELPADYVVQAYRYGSGVYNVSRTQARNFNNLFFTNRTYPCWTRSSDIMRVSMTVVYEAVPDANCVVAIFLTVFCSGIAVMIVVLTLLDACFDDDLLNDTDLESPPPRPKPRRFILNRDQIQHVIDSYRLPVSEKEKEWTCSICLDGCSSDGDSSRESSGTVSNLDEDRPRDRGKLICLPCNHTFHEGCISEWMRRGGNSCPLCKFQLADLFAVVKRLAGLPDQILSSVLPSRVQVVGTRSRDGSRAAADGDTTRPLLVEQEADRGGEVAEGDGGLPEEVGDREGDIVSAEGVGTSQRERPSTPPPVSTSS